VLSASGFVLIEPSNVIYLILNDSRHEGNAFAAGNADKDLQPTKVRLSSLILRIRCFWILSLCAATFSIHINTPYLFLRCSC
jgi:hypothetical protein